MVVESRQGMRFHVGKWYYIGNDRVLRQNLERFVHLHLADPKTRIALYGAGKHTQRLLKMGVIPPGQIRAIFDDLTPCEDIQGIPVLKPRMAAEIDFDILLVSSDSVWEDLVYKAQRWMPKGRKIENLYSDLQD